MTTRPSVAVVAALLALAIVCPTASAQPPGPPVTSRGSFVLGDPAGPGDYAEHFLEDYGFSPHPGDTFHFAWNATGNGTVAVYFELHAHGAAGYVNHYSITASADEGFWRVPGTDPYMIFWRNVGSIGSGPVNVTYEFLLHPGGEDSGLAAVSLVAILTPAVLVLSFVFWRVRRRRAREGRGPVRAGGTDPEEGSARSAREPSKPPELRPPPHS